MEAIATNVTMVSFDVFSSQFMEFPDCATNIEKTVQQTSGSKDKSY